MTKFFVRLNNFWSTDRSLTVLLGFIVLTVFVAPIFHRADYQLRLFLDISWSFILISGFFFATAKRTLLIAASVIVTLSLTFRWFAYFHPSPVLLILSSMSLLISMGFLVVVVLSRVFRDGPITIARVQGSVVVYLLLGLIWAAAYQTIALWDPSAFKMDVEPDNAEHLAGRLIYYSFVTLTTVGYGDITAIHPMARSLSILEALCGQLYPAILIARLVSMQLQSKAR